MTRGVLCLCLALGACAVPGERVILLPQPEPSAVVVRTDKGEQQINQAYQAVLIERSGGLTVQQLDAASVNQRYGALLQLQAPPPQRFVLEFEFAQARLTALSLAQIPTIVEKTLASAASEVVVVGHTDTMGTHALNDALSTERALVVRQLLISNGLPPERVSAHGRGKRELLIPTADAVDEPRNRRVEILIR